MSDEITAILLGDVRATLARFVHLPDARYLDALTLWVAHTYCLDAAETTPRVIFKSPEKECGKTRALEVLEVLVRAPLLTMNASVAAIFRLLKEEGATLLLDEVDAIFGGKLAGDHEDLRALLCAGYRRGATVARVTGEGKKMHVERFPVFAPAALAAIGDLPDTLESRSLIVPMRRRAPDEPLEPFRRRRINGEADRLRGSLSDWALDYGDRLKDAEPQTPDDLGYRAADCWEPLLAIADLAGDGWPDRARAASRLLAGGDRVDEQSIGVRLLADIRTVFTGRDRLASAELCRRLNGLPESPWGGWNKGASFQQRDLAHRLKLFGIRSKNVRLLDGSVPKGYDREQFLDAWRRYLHSQGSATGATSATETEFNSGTVADVAPVADTTEEGRAGKRCPDGHECSLSEPTGSWWCCGHPVTSEEAMR